MQQGEQAHPAGEHIGQDFRDCGALATRLPIPIQVANLQSQWVAVGKAWQDCHSSCEMCDWHVEKSQRLPYGEGSAVEFYSVCTLGERGEKPCQCPAMQVQAEEQQA